MKHFLIEITYTVPLEQIDAIVADHRAFLQTGYDRGMLLYSGGQVPRTGGLVLARAESRAAVEQFFAADPYHLHGAATYRIVEFNPVKYQGFLKDWVEGN